MTATGRRRRLLSDQGKPRGCLHWFPAVNCHGGSVAYKSGATSVAGKWTIMLCCVKVVGLWRAALEQPPSCWSVCCLEEIKTERCVPLPREHGWSCCPGSSIDRWRAVVQLQACLALTGSPGGRFRWILPAYSNSTC